jgi:hypothetical protein
MRSYPEITSEDYILRVKDQFLIHVEDRVFTYPNAANIAPISGEGLEVYNPDLQRKSNYEYFSPSQNEYGDSNRSGNVSSVMFWLTTARDNEKLQDDSQCLGGTIDLADSFAYFTKLNGTKPPQNIASHNILSMKAEFQELWRFNQIKWDGLSSSLIPNTVCRRATWINDKNEIVKGNDMDGPLMYSTQGEFNVKRFIKKSRGSA